MHRNLPLGFGMELAQNSTAMQRFCNMSEQQQAAILKQAKSVSSKTEMEQLVSSLSAQG